MAKLYPPILPTSIPAFRDISNGSQVAIKIPLKLNPSVSLNDINTWQVKISQPGGTKIYESGTTSLKNDTYKRDKGYLYYSSDVLKSELIPGNYYKVQVACNNSNNEIGFYSYAAIFKYVGSVSASIIIDEVNELSINDITYGKKVFTGRYQHEDDFTEKAYSYQFKIYDSEGRIIQDSGERFHKYEVRDTSTISYDTYELLEELPEDGIYQIEYIVKTINGLEIKSPLYKIQQKYFLMAEYDFWDIIPELDSENGIVRITTKWNTIKPEIKLVEGFFRLMRFDHERKYWSEIDKFELITASVKNLNFIDVTVENGHSYTYAFQQYTINKETKKEQIASNYFGNSHVVKVFLEHSYLSDCERQLKIAYNPQINSLKTNILETKTNTIGAKYPYFYRNGQVEYKEFSISGLISLISDEDGLFWSQKIVDNNTRNTTPGFLVNTNSLTNLTNDNFYNEYLFKTKVLDWLNNGEVKLFRSAAEGAYLVRLSNVSLSPNTQLGRMLHTFTATATEVMDLNYNNLNKLGYYHKFNGNQLDTPDLTYWRTVPKIKFFDDIGRDLLPNNQHTVQVDAIRLEGFAPGDQFQIGIKNQNNETEFLEIIINRTGNYYYTGFVTSVKFLGNLFPNSRPRDTEEGGQLTYRIQAYTNSYFKMIQRTETKNYALIQYRGSDYPLDSEDNSYTENIIEDIENIKHNSIFKYLRFYVDDFICPKLEGNNQQVYNTCIKIQPKGQNEPAIIDIGNKNIDEIKEAFKKIGLTITDRIYYYEIKGIQEFKSIQLGTGVVGEFSYDLHTKFYQIEEFDEDYLSLMSFIEDYELLLNNVLLKAQTVNHLSSLFGVTENKYRTVFNEVSYKNFGLCYICYFDNTNFTNSFLYNILHYLYPEKSIDILFREYKASLQQGKDILTDENDNFGGQSKMTIENVLITAQIAIDYLKDLQIIYLEKLLTDINIGELVLAPKLGDINGDGNIDINDLIWLVEAFYNVRQLKNWQIATATVGYVENGATKEALPFAPRFSDNNGEFFVVPNVEYWVQSGLSWQQKTTSQNITITTGEIVYEENSTNIDDNFYLYWSNGTKKMLLKKAHAKNSKNYTNRGDDEVASNGTIKFSTVFTGNRHYQSLKNHITNTNNPYTINNEQVRNYLSNRINNPERELYEKVLTKEFNIH